MNYKDFKNKVINILNKKYGVISDSQLYDEVKHELPTMYDYHLIKKIIFEEFQRWNELINDIERFLYNLQMYNFWELYDQFKEIYDQFYRFIENKDGYEEYKNTIVEQVENFPKNIRAEEEAEKMLWDWLNELKDINNY